MGKKLGEGMHASVYMCFANEDVDKKKPLAVKISRESDEEKKMAHEKEYEMTSSRSHVNVVKSI